MGSLLRSLGLILLVIAAWAVLADELGWVGGEFAGSLLRPMVIGAILCLGIGFLLRVLSPVARELERGRCVRCSSRTERGQVYCRDHLQETVHEYQDEVRRREYEEATRRT